MTSSFDRSPLERRRARLAVITAVEARYNALCYVGGTAQQNAAARHAQAEAQDDWRSYDACRQREEDAQHRAPSLITAQATGAKDVTLAA